MPAAAPGRVFVLGGATAAGKSSLALDLAERFGTPVVSADAMTVYRGLDVGTAKPTPAELQRVPHHGIDVRDPDGEFSVADFVTLVESLAASHPRVLVVGGTPFYLRGLVRPLAPLPPADPRLRAELEALHDLHVLLAEVDPVSAARRHPHDRVRLVRALEVYRLTGVPLSEHHKRDLGAPRLSVQLVWLDRDDLKERIEKRVLQMMRCGYVQETQRALERYGPSIRPLRSFAYRYFVGLLQGELSETEAVHRTTSDTWRFARKQRTFARGMGWEASTAEEVRLRAAACFTE